MDAMTFWDAVGRESVQRMCREIGTSYDYWKHIANRRKRPSVDLARKMVDYSRRHHPDHALSLDELLVPRELIRNR